jgi:hypothetical protein
MGSKLCIKPYHLPVLLAVSLVLLSCSDARIPRKPHIGSGPPALLRRHLKQIPNSDPNATSSPDAIIFTKHLTSVSPGDIHDNITTVTLAVAEGALQRDFEELNVFTKGLLSNTLSELLEWKLLELQVAVRHARQAKDDFDQMTLAADAVACPLCNPTTTPTNN